MSHRGLTQCRRALDQPAHCAVALGWSATLRRSELVGLDWEKAGSGTGSVRIDERGIVVVLAVSKSSQTEPVTIAVPLADARRRPLPRRGPRPRTCIRESPCFVPSTSGSASAPAG
jgi:hypothetical protein